MLKSSEIYPADQIIPLFSHVNGIPPPVVATLVEIDNNHYISEIFLNPTIKP
jgi:hypothetical protein